MLRAIFQAMPMRQLVLRGAGDDGEHAPPPPPQAHESYLWAPAPLHLYRNNYIKHLKEGGSKQKVCDRDFRAKCKGEFGKLPEARRAHSERDVDLTRESAKRARLRKRQRTEQEAMLSLGPGPAAAPLGIEDRCCCCGSSLVNHRPQMWRMHLVGPDPPQRPRDPAATTDFNDSISPTKACATESFPLSAPVLGHFHAEKKSLLKAGKECTNIANRNVGDPVANGVPKRVMYRKSCGACCKAGSPAIKLAFCREPEAALAAKFGEHGAASEVAGNGVVFVVELFQGGAEEPTDFSF